jgi:hypothetical protein
MQKTTGGEVETGEKKQKWPRVPRVGEEVDRGTLRD